MNLNRFLRVLVPLLAVTSVSSSCSAPVTAGAVRLAGPVVIEVVKNQAIRYAIKNGADQTVARVAVGGAVSLVGQFAFDQVQESIYTDDEAWYVTIHHWIDDSPVTSVIKLEDNTNLGIKIKGEADVYFFQEDRRFLFDALKYEDTQITVFNTESDFEAFAEGTVTIPEVQSAYDLNTLSLFTISDRDFLPEYADLLFVEEERYALLVNGAVAVSRHGITPTRDLCESIPDEAWRANLLPSNMEDQVEGWCVKTAEGDLGSIVATEDGKLQFELWVKEVT